MTSEPTQHRIGAVSALSGVPVPTLRVWESRYGAFTPAKTGGRHRLYTEADVLRATDCVVPCFEIVDSRIKDWKIKIQDTVADNASCGVLVLGGVRKSPRKLDLALAGMVLAKNGDIISTSTGAAVQGSPVNAIAWLANTLGRLGIGLKAGEIILSGSQSPLVPVVAGDSLTCNVGGLGGTSVRFI